MRSERTLSAVVLRLRLAFPILQPVPPEEWEAAFTEPVLPAVETAVDPILATEPIAPVPPSVEALSKAARAADLRRSLNELRQDLMQKRRPDRTSPDGSEQAA